MVRKRLMAGIIIAAIVLASFSLAAAGRQETVSDAEMGPLVPELVILSSLPESNLVNYEMAQELAEEL